VGAPRAWCSQEEEFALPIKGALLFTREDPMQRYFANFEELYADAIRTRLCVKCPYSAVCLAFGGAIKIKVVKHWRKRTGDSLVDAKKAVEERMRCQ
jgi:hypothetical protein